MQVLHYLDGELSDTGEGEYYKPHYDFFHKVDDEYWASHIVKAGGQRNWSAIIYLNNVEEGGETYYPEIDLSVKPEMGKIMFHKNCDETSTDLETGGGLIKESLHEARPVIKGEKWALVIWSRIRNYATIQYVIDYIYNNRGQVK